MGGGGGAPDDPGDISGCLLWLRADSGVTEDANGAVSAWQSRCGNVVAAQSTVAHQPERLPTAGPNATPTIDFVPTEFDYLSLAGLTSGSQEYTVYAVLNPRSTAGSQALMGSESANARYFGFANASGLVSVRDPGNNVTCFAASTGDQWLSWEIGRGGTPTVACTRSDMASGGAGWSGTWSWTDPVLGAWKFQGFHYDGTVAEVVLYDHALSTTERTIIETYLTMRYGL